MAEWWKGRRLRRAPRTVIGYHGCSRATAERITAGERFAPSAKRYDWLGVGIYFWEYGPFRAWEWAEGRHGDEAAVLEATLRLGQCLNLLDVEHHDHFAEVYEQELQAAARDGVPIPSNTERGGHYRDRYMIEVYCRAVSEQTGAEFQTVRACFPEGEPLFPGSNLLSHTHVQLSVRDDSCITRLRRVR